MVIAAYWIHCVVCLSYTVGDLLSDALVEFLHALVSFRELSSVKLNHVFDLLLVLLLQQLQLVVELTLESLEGVLYPLYLCISELFVRLNLSSNVLELCLQLLLRLNALSQHHIVIVVHLRQLMCHRLEVFVIMLKRLILFHY